MSLMIEGSLFRGKPIKTRTRYDTNCWNDRVSQGGELSFTIYAAFRL